MAVPSETQRNAYLQGLREGKTRMAAAERANSTGSRFRSLMRNDTGFTQQVLEAEEEAHEDYVERLAREVRHRAVEEVSERVLLWEAEAHLPQYAYKRTKHIRQEGEIAHTLGLAPEVLALMPEHVIDRLIAIEEEKRALLAKTPELKAIEGGG